MTVGVGGSNRDTELAQLTSLRGTASPISDQERHERIADVQRRMSQHGIAALYLDASTSLYYFTGTRFWASER